MKQEQDSQPRRLIVGISGASGVIYGVRALEMPTISLRDRLQATTGRSARLGRACPGQYRRVHCVGFVPDGGHAGTALLDKDHERDCLRHHQHAADTGG